MLLAPDGAGVDVRAAQPIIRQIVHFSGLWLSVVFSIATVMVAVVRSGERNHVVGTSWSLSITWWNNINMSDRLAELGACDNYCNILRPFQIICRHFTKPLNIV